MQLTQIPRGYGKRATTLMCVARDPNMKLVVRKSELNHAKAYLKELQKTCEWAKLINLEKQIISLEDVQAGRIERKAL